MSQQSVEAGRAHDRLPKHYSGKITAVDRPLANQKLNAEKSKLYGRLRSKLKAWLMVQGLTIKSRSPGTRPHDWTWIGSVLAPSRCHGRENYGTFVDSDCEGYYWINPKFTISRSK